MHRSSAQYHFITFRCARLGIKCLAYLWQREQGRLLQDMIDSQVHAVLIKVATLGNDD